MVFQAVFLCTTLSISGLSLADGPKPITYVSYNLRNYLSLEPKTGEAEVSAAPKPADEVAAVVEALTAISPDILSVSEIGDESFVADLQRRLSENGIDLPHTELVVSADGYNRNLALLSRFPIVQRSSRDDYTYRTGESHLPFQRGVLDVTVEVTPDYRLRCIGLHLKSKREVPDGDQELMRLNEARLARKHIEKILHSDLQTNLIVTGDFNALKMEPPVKSIQGAYGQSDYLTALPLSDSRGETWTQYWSYADVYSRFDYALFNKSLRSEIDKKSSYIHHWDNWEKASDHRPLVIRIVPEDK